MGKLPAATQFYINGKWVAPSTQNIHHVIDPSTDKAVADVAYGNASDVDAAVAAAKNAFTSFSRSSIAERMELLQAINAKMKERLPQFAAAITAQMGAPDKLSQFAQAPSGPRHFEEIIRILPDYKFEEQINNTLLKQEAVGVCALITPWNWPLNQIATKVAPALAAGCTMVLKPSEMAPLDAVLLTEIIDEVGVPAGVFNLIHGDGIDVGTPLVQHKDVDMISFTGSTRAGIAISENAAKGIKRVALELGGKSANIILDDANLTEAIPKSVMDVMMNSGQSCNAPTRMLVPAAKYNEIAAMVKATAEAVTVGAPHDENTAIGPIANKNQYKKVQALIEKGQAEGAELLCGGADMPNGLADGYYIAPTVFGKVHRDMTIAIEEIFGPVLSIMPYESEAQALDIANDSEYGLSGAVWSADVNRAVEIASQIRTGMVHINGAPLDSAAPFGGYKKSGNGREWGEHGLKEFLEVKSIYGAVV